MDAVDLRTQNLAALMRHIFTRPPTTRNDLSEATGLTRMTITNLSSELLARGILCEVDAPVRPAGPGRVAKLLALSDTSPVVAGVWLAKSFLHGVVTDLALQVQLSERVPLAATETADSVLAKTLDLACTLIDRAERPVIGLGLALAGVVDPGSGSIERITDFHGIERIDVQAHLAAHLDLPIFADNMMHASALAELHYGHGQVLPEFIYVGMTEGVGAAIVSGGRTVSADRASGGELGHMSIEYGGPTCGCGSRGCLELYVSVPLLHAAIDAAAGVAHASPREAFECCSDDPAAGAVLTAALDRMAFALNNVINLIDVCAVVVGNDSFHIPDAFLDAMADTLNRVSLFRGLHRISVSKSRFGDTGPAFGAAAIVTDRLFSGLLCL